MTCQHCGSRTQLYLCRHCTQHLRTILLDLVIGPETTNHHSHPGLIEHLQDAAYGHTHFNEPTSHNHGRITTPPINPKASQLLDDVHTLMTRIAAQLPYCATNTAPMGANPQTLALRAAAHTQTIARRPDAAQTLRELHHLTNRILAAIDKPQPRHPCGLCDCGNQLTAPTDATQVMCRDCGIIHQIEDLHRNQMQNAIADGAAFTRELFPAAMAMAGTPISDRTFRRWRHDGRLPISGYENNEPLYRPLDIKR